jgi:hypothetical protein
MVGLLFGGDAAKAAVSFAALKKAAYTLHGVAGNLFVSV